MNKLLSKLEAKRDPPNQVVNLRSVGAITLTLMLSSAINFVSSFCNLSVNPVKFVPPPERIILAKKFFTNSSITFHNSIKSRFMNTRD